MKTKRITSIVLAVLIIGTAFIMPLSANAVASSKPTISVEWEQGRYNADTGAPEGENYGFCIRSNDYIDVSYYDKISVNNQSGYSYNIHFYDKSYDFISSSHGQFAYATEPGEINVAGDLMTISIYKNPITVSEGSNITIKGNYELSPALIDEEEKGTLTIHKYEMSDVSAATTVGTGYEVGDINLPTNATPINGIGFQIIRIADLNSNYFTPNGNSLPTPTAAASMQALNTYYRATANVNGKDGIAKFENLPLGIYLVREVDRTVPPHITKSADFVISIPITSSDNQSWKYDIDVYPKNQSTYANIRIKKADYLDNSIGLSGGSFNVWQSENNSTFTQVSSVTTGSDGYAVQTHLPVNHYYRLGEATAPTGYILDNYNNQYNQTYFYLDESGRILSRDKNTVIGTQQSITYNSQSINAATITITNSKPTIEKFIDKSKGAGTNLIKGTTSVIADYSYYVVKVRTPKVNSMSTLNTFKVTDNIQGTIVEPTIVKITKSTVNGTALNSSDYTFTATTTSTTTEKNYTTELVFDTTKLDADTDYYIMYKCYVTKTTTNKATLVYTNKTLSDTTTTSSIDSNTVKFYRYSYNFMKVDPENNALEGAQFQIFETEADARALKNPIKVLSWTINGAYTRSSNSSGYVQFAGLPVGDTEIGSKDFWITEIKAPTVTNNGTTIQYNLLAEPIRITANNSTATYEKGIKVVNSPKLDFPLTGSTGTLILIIVGVLFLGATFVMLVIKKKKQKQS